MLNAKSSLFTVAILGAILISSSAAYAKPLHDDIKNQGVEGILNIKMALQKGLPSGNVDAHVNHDIIQFSGFVDNAKQYRLVRKIAAKYKSDYRVINNVKILSVKGNPDDEAKLRNNVIHQLNEHKYPTESIDVQVRNGHVLLSGFVDRDVELNKIKNISQQVPGVKQVDNFLLYRQI